MNNLDPIPLNERRYIVGYDPIIATTTKALCVVFVVDKLNQRVVYKIRCKDRLKAYPSIKRMYDLDNCIPPKCMRLELFE